MTGGTMTFEIGLLTSAPSVAAPPAPAASPVERPVPAAPAGPVDRSDIIPASPPGEVLAEVDAAWERAEMLAAVNRQLHFERDEEAGRIIIEIRTFDGEVLKTIPPSGALNIMSGAAV
jgi:FlaG protein